MTEKSTPQTKTKRHSKRAATEAAIVDAFGRLIARDGIRRAGVNALVKEAGVGKGLIYKYFGGLAGVVKAWGEQNKLWPSSAELMGISDEAFSGLSPADQMKTVLRDHMTALRNNPVALDVLAEELTAPDEISEAFSEARKRLGTEHQAIYSTQHVMRAEDNRTLSIVLHAAANYLAMRAHRAPRFMGETLDTEDGWETTLARMERLIDVVMAHQDDDERSADKAYGPSDRPPAS